MKIARVLVPLQVSHLRQDRLEFVCVVVVAPVVVVVVVVVVPVDVVDVDEDFRAVSVDDFRLLRRSRHRMTKKRAICRSRFGRRCHECFARNREEGSLRMSWFWN